MTIRNLDALLRPKSVAVIGVGARPQGVGAVTFDNLRKGGFAGPVWPVGRHATVLDGVPCFAGIADLPAAPDLAVICTPAAGVPDLIAQLGARGTRGVIVLSAGFGEMGAAGAALQQQMLDAARPHCLRIIGPNCVGMALPGQGLNASFLPAQVPAGDLALVSQSGAVAAAIADWAGAHNVGFSHIVSLGGAADVDCADMLDWLAVESATRAILLYVESLRGMRKFLSAARAAARLKPVLAMKAGRSAEGAKAAASHTGALAGSDTLYDAAFRRAGILRVDALEELFDAAATLASGVRVRGDRLVIVTNGGGLGVLATDRLVAEGGRLAPLDAATIAALDACLPAHWSKGNPVDIIGDAGPERYTQALEAVLRDANVDAALVINCPTAVADSNAAASATIAAAAAHGDRAVLASWVGERSAGRPRHRLAEAGLPSFATPEEAVSAFMHLVRHAKAQELLLETPPSVPALFATNRDVARGLVLRALAGGPGWMRPEDAVGVIAAYGIPTVPTEIAATPEAAADAAARIGGAVALKIRSPDLTHKSDIGGVQLNLRSPSEVAEAAARMLARIGAARPQARLEGFAVSAMVDRSDAIELIVGMVEDPLFGPVVMFGQGGVAVEILQDSAVGFPPLNPPLARDMIGRTRVSRLLKAYRGRPAADAAAIELALMRVAQIAIDLPQIVELDINPLLAGESGVRALDVRIRVATVPAAGDRRLAIRPYPSELEERAELPGAGAWLLRPIRPEDEPRLAEMVARCSPDDCRLRFFHVLRGLPHQMAARLSQIDYEREMAFVAEAGDGSLEGVVRLAADPDNREAEFAILVRSDRQRRGLGRRLMEKTIDYARARGTGALVGRVMAENQRMLRLCNTLGFEASHDAGEMSVLQVRKPLRDA